MAAGDGSARHITDTAENSKLNSYVTVAVKGEDTRYELDAVTNVKYRKVATVNSSNLDSLERIPERSERVAARVTDARRGTNAVTRITGVKRGRERGGIGGTHGRGYCNAAQRVRKVGDMRKGLKRG